MALLIRCLFFLLNDISDLSDSHAGLSDPIWTHSKKEHERKQQSDRLVYGV